MLLKLYSTLGKSAPNQMCFVATSYILRWPHLVSLFYLEEELSTPLMDNVDAVLHM